MEDYTLESEFAVYADRHKENTLRDDITRHYTDLYKTGVQIPDFMMNKTPVEMADEEYSKVLQNSNSSTINKLYEEAYRRNVKYIEGWGEQPRIMAC